MVKASPLRPQSASNRCCCDEQACAETDYDCKGALRSSQSHIRKLKERNELRSLYKQLREVVPSCKAQPVTSLDIVLRAVDYINELHRMLGREGDDVETGPAVPGVPGHLDTEVNVKSASFHDITNVTTSTDIRTTPRIH